MLYLHLHEARQVSSYLTLFTRLPPVTRIKIKKNICWRILAYCSQHIQRWQHQTRLDLMLRTWKSLMLQFSRMVALWIYTVCNANVKGLTLISQIMCVDVIRSIYMCCLPFLKLTLLKGAYSVSCMVLNMFVLALCMSGVPDPNFMLNHTPCVQTSKVWHQNLYARTLDCFLAKVKSINLCSWRIELQNKSKSD